MAFDFRLLANKIVNNNQFRLPPADVARMGEIVGYDPAFNDLASGNTYPSVSVSIGGDVAPMHGVRFGETYVPNIGDTVMLQTSGHDAYVLHAFAGADKDTIGSVRSASGILAHSTSLSQGSAGAKPASIVTSVLPGRLYRVEVSSDFNVSSAGRASQASIDVTAPDGKVLTLGKLSVSQNTNYTFHGFALWSDMDATNWASKYPQVTGVNPQGTWTVGLNNHQFDSALPFSSSNANGYITGDVVSIPASGSTPTTYYVAQRTLYTYSSSNQYINGDAVMFNGAVYQCIYSGSTLLTKGTAPTNTSDWQQVYSSASPTADTYGKFWQQEKAPTTILGTHSIVVHDLGVANPQPFSN
jgi:hypothetical protein